MPSRKRNRVLVQGPLGLPLQIPAEIFAKQAVLGPVATLLWINLAVLAQRQHPLQVKEIAAEMGLAKREVQKALALLADYGWINDEGLEIRLTIPPENEGEKEGAATQESILDEGQASFEWLISYCSARAGKPTPEQMRKLFHWMEEKGLSHEVIAVAVEEMSAYAKTPGFAYLEGILRNWHAMGIRSYNDLLENPHLTKVLAPIAAQREYSSAEERWKEVFPDEFD